MKNIFLFCTLLIILGVTGCKYEDYMVDYTYNAVYFPATAKTRTFVVGENKSIEMGVVLGGKRENKTDEWIDFEIDPTIIPAGSTLLPANYYTLSNNSRFIIPSGTMQGAITLTIDTAKFLNDPLALQAKYVLPVRLTATSADSILPAQSFQILSLKYEHKLFGNYYHNGVTTVTSSAGATSTIGYHQEEPVTNALNNWILSTVGPYTLKTDGLSNQKGGINNTFNMTIKNDNSVVVGKNGASTIAVSQNGACTYNPSKREFYLNYSYVNAGSTYQVTDTLIFRNRILDGVNQWR